MSKSQINIENLLEIAAHTHKQSSPSSQVSLQVQRILSTEAKTSQYSLERGNRLIAAFGKVQKKVFAGNHHLVPPLM